MPAIKPKLFVPKGDVQRMLVAAQTPLEKTLIKVLTTTGLRIAEVGETQWERFFKVHGCIDCKRKDVKHKASGFCAPCFRHVSRAVKHIAKGLVS
jgi:hypothetical protein